MGKLYVMRHSITYYIEIGRFAGNMDIPLSKKGIKDALNLGRNYDYNNFDVVFTSQLSRSFDTAVLFLSQLELKKIPIKISFDEYPKIAKSDLLPIIQFQELNERDYGVLQNMDKHEIRNRYSNELLKNWRRDYYGEPEQGESFQHVVSRTATFYFNVLLPILENNDVLVVAHQNSIRALYYLIYNVRRSEIDNIEFSNSDIWSIDYEAITNSAQVHNNDIFILAAGNGTRMGELTKHSPKPLLKINNRPIIDYAIEHLKKRHLNINVIYSNTIRAWNSYIKNNTEISFYPTNISKSYHDNFIDAFLSIREHANYTYVLSGDMVFDCSLFDKAIQEHIINQNDVTVVLNRKHGKQKKWKYIFQDNFIINDIIMENNIQPYERYFLIINSELMFEYIRRLTVEQYLYEKNKKFGTGATFLLKNMIDLGFVVNYVEFDSELVNVNRPDDLKQATKLIRKIYGK